MADAVIRNEGRVLVDYVCVRKQHVLATVFATPEGPRVRPMQLPVYDAGNRPGTISRKVARDAVPDLPIGRQPYWSVGLTCACRLDFQLDEVQVQRDVSAGVRRVVLHAIR